jgi:hypothetical protein
VLASRTRMVLDGAVHLNHTVGGVTLYDSPKTGSDPGVAPALEPLNVPVAPDSVTRLDSASLGGNAAHTSRQ